MHEPSMKAAAGLIPANSSYPLPIRFVCRTVQKPSPLAILGRLFVTLGLTLFVTAAPAQNRPLVNAWQSLERLPDRSLAEVWIRAERHQAVALDHVALHTVLDGAPQEASQPVVGSPAEILLP